MERVPLLCRLLAVAVVALVLASCRNGDGTDDAATTSAATEPAVTTSTTTLPTTSSTPTTPPTSDATRTVPTGTAPTSPATSDTSPPTGSCVDGWVTPERGTELRAAPLDALRAWYDVSGPFVVDDMRYFEGPQDPAILLPDHDYLRHWYVKAWRQSDPDFQARWLLVAPPDMLPALDAVAPYDSTGFAPGDWVGFFGESDELFEMPGLPGSYHGVAFDFVTGIVFDTGEPDGGPFGLPSENQGCLAGT